MMKYIYGSPTLIILRKCLIHKKMEWFSLFCFVFDFQLMFKDGIYRNIYPIGEEKENCSYLKRRINPLKQLHGPRDN